MAATLQAWLQLPSDPSQAEGELRAYPSATDALAAAAAAKGGTVRLAAGVYAEGKLKVAAGVSLVGEGVDKTVVQSGGGSAIVCAAGAVRIADLEARQPAEATAAPAYAIEVRGAAAAAAATEAPPGVHIERCRLVAASATKLSAALLVHSASAAISHCELRSAAAHGVVLASAARLHAAAGEIADCGSCGILALSGTQLRAEGLEIRGCGESALLLSGKGAAATLTGCLISGGAAAHAAVHVKAGARATMHKCELDAPEGVGLQLAEGAAASLHGTTIHRAGRAAVAARSALEMLLQDCTISDSRGVGVMAVRCGPRVALRGCSIRGSAKAAVQISEIADEMSEALGQLAQLSDSSASRAADAVSASGSSAGGGPLVEGCIISSCGAVGVDVFAGAAPSLRNNVLDIHI